MTFPITDPTLIFLIVLCIILLSPVVMGKLRIPHIVGLVLSGVVIGPDGLGILAHSDSFRLFGNVGLYYILFLAGLEMDHEGLRRDVRKVWFFGLLTFIIPWILTFFTARWLLNYGLTASLLLSCIMSSNTLIAYPLIQRYGMSGHVSVRLSVGSSMMALFFSLVVLACIVSNYDGSGGVWFWLLFPLKLLLFFFVMFFFLPRVVRWFLRHYSDAAMQYTFVLTMLFVSAVFSDLIGLEGILGAFFSGLIMGRFIPSVSALMNRIEFTGNTLFIPFFLIGVGMLINCRLLFAGEGILWVTLIIVVIGTLGKALAAYLSCIFFRLPFSSGHMMTGLTTAHAAGAIAIVMVGMRLSDAAGQPLVSSQMLNAVVLMVLFTCIISTMLTQRTVRRLAVSSETGSNVSQFKPGEAVMLLPMKYLPEADRLLSLAVMMRRRRSTQPLVAVNVVFDGQHREQHQEEGRKLLKHIAQQATAADVPIQTQVRVAENIANGIKHAFKEHHATEIVMGMHRKTGLSTKYWGQFTQSLYNGLSRQIMFARINQPLNTLRRILVAIPSRAEYERGFYQWVERLLCLAANLDCRIVFRGREETLSLIRTYAQNMYPSARTDYLIMQHWNELPRLSKDVKEDHLFVVVTSRKDAVSYKKAQEHLPEELERHFSHTNVIILFPHQYGTDKEQMSFTESQHQEEESAYSLLRKWLKHIKKMIIR